MGYREYFSYVISTCLGLGYWPWGPGTATTLVIAPIWWWLGLSVSWEVYWALVAIVTLLGLLATSEVLHLLHVEDPSEVVVDEVAGCGIAFACFPDTLLWAVLAVVIFRILDIWKPWPIRAIERNTPGAAGVMLDDLVAGGLTVALILLLKIPTA